MARKLKLKRVQENRIKELYVIYICTGGKYEFHPKLNREIFHAKWKVYHTCTSEAEAETYAEFARGLSYNRLVKVSIL